MNSPEDSLNYFKRESRIFLGSGKPQVTGLSFSNMQIENPDLFAIASAMLKGNQDPYLRAGFAFARETEKRYPFAKDQFEKNLIGYSATCNLDMFRAGIDIYLVVASTQSEQNQSSSPLLRSIG